MASNPFPRAVPRRGGRSGVLSGGYGGRGPRGRGFTVLELGISMGIFVVVAGLVSLAITAAAGNQITQRNQSALGQELINLSNAVAGAPYSQLLANTFIPPEQCAGSGVGTAATSCVSVLHKDYTVSWTRTLAADALGGSGTGSALSITITASATETGGAVATHSVQINEPTLGYQPGYGTLALRVDASGGTYTGSIYLLNGTTTVASGTASAGGGTGVSFAAMRAVSSACTTASPCSLALSPSGSDLDAADSWVLSGDGAAGVSANIVLSDGGAVWRDATVAVAGAATLNLAAAPASSTVGQLDTLAGTGTSASSSDAGSATATSLDSPQGVAAGPDGSIYIADTPRDVITRLSGGTLSVVAGQAGVAGSSGDGGLATAAELNHPVGVAVDSSGDLFIADSDNCEVREVLASTGKISTVAGTGTCGSSGSGGTATSTEMGHVTGVAVDGSGDLYLADSSNCVVDEVSGSSGNLTTVAGQAGACTSSGSSGSGATAVSLHTPRAVALDSSGNLFIAETGGNRVWELAAKDESAFGVSMSAGDLYVVAGTGTAGGAGSPGPGTSAQLDSPGGVAAAAGGFLYIANSGAHVIDQVDPSSGHLITVAGTGSVGYTSAGPAPTSALSNPVGIGAGLDGGVMVADASNGVVQAVSFDSGSQLVAGSVCVWGTFANGSVSVTAPFCNTASPESISIATYAPDPTDPTQVVPVPTGTPISLSSDDPDGTCPASSGILAYTASGWAAEGVCSSWTWGPPTTVAPLNGSATSFTGTSITLTAGVDSGYQAVWSSSAAAPATGVGTTSTWSIPRLAPTCAAADTCTVVPALDYEATYCSTSDPSCLS